MKNLHLLQCKQISGGMTIGKTEYSDEGISPKCSEVIASAIKATLLGLLTLNNTAFLIITSGCTDDYDTFYNNNFKKKKEVA